jgi:DNA-binding transcriptional ArsR family regulator
MGIFMTTPIRIVEDAKFIRALLDETRRKMVLEMTREPRTLTQLAKKFGKTPATIHYHIGKLSEAGIVKLVKTRVVNNNIVEKYYQTTLSSSCIVGFGLGRPLRGPVPPKRYEELKAYLALDKQNLAMIMKRLGVRPLDGREKELLKAINDFISAVPSDSIKVFRGIYPQLELQVPSQSLQRLESIIGALPIIVLLEVFKSPEYLSVLQRMIRSIGKAS